MVAAGNTPYVTALVSVVRKLLWHVKGECRLHSHLLWASTPPTPTHSCTARSLPTACSCHSTQASRYSRTTMSEDMLGDSVTPPRAPGLLGTLHSVRLGHVALMRKAPVAQLKEVQVDPTVLRVQDSVARARC